MFSPLSRSLLPFSTAGSSMLQVLRPRLGVHGHLLLSRPKGIGSGCVRRGRRRLSTTSEPSKAAADDDEPGWPLKYKLAGGAVLGAIIPWMFSYAVANDPGSRRLVARLSPGLVQWFRNREKGGHFFDEDPKRVAYLAQASDWIDQPVTMEVRTGSGETRRMQDLDARTPFSSVGGLVHADGSGGGGTGGHAGWLTDFDVLDEGGAGDGEGEGRQASSPSWDTSSSSGSSGSSGSGSRSSYQSDSGYTTSDAVRRAVAACNIRSWWDIAAMEEERARQPAPPPAATAAAASASSSPSAAPRAGSSSSAGGVASAPSGVTMGAAMPSRAKKMSNAEQAQAMIEHLEVMVESLEQDKLTGARSVDDVEEEVRDLRKQQRELRRKHPGRRRFLGLF